MRTLLLAASLAFAGALSAQNCGTLAITGTGAPGTDETFAISGATPDSFAVLFIGETAGTTTLSFGMLTIDVGLDRPFIPVLIGRTDSNGDISRTVTLPPHIPQQFSLNGQGMAVSFTLRPFSVSACVTNVVAFTIG